jgi:hypothetical protein
MSVYPDIMISCNSKQYFETSLIIRVNFISGDKLGGGGGGINVRRHYKITLYVTHITGRCAHPQSIGEHGFHRFWEELSCLGHLLPVVEMSL